MTTRMDDVSALLMPHHTHRYVGGPAREYSNSIAMQLNELLNKLDERCCLASARRTVWTGMRIDKMIRIPTFN